MNNLSAMNIKLCNYISLADRLNPEAEKLKLELQKLQNITPNPEEKNSFPVLDKIIILDLSLEKILERAASLKKDPTTGIIYDPVINPAPENDKKLMARLEAVEVDQEAI